MAKAVILLAAMAVLAVVLPSSEAFDFRFKRELSLDDAANIDEKKYLQNKRAVEFQIQCVVYDGPCDPLGKLIKKHIKEILQHECSPELDKFCTPENKARLQHIAEHLEQNYPQAVADAKKKYLGE